MRKITVFYSLLFLAACGAAPKIGLNGQGGGQSNGLSLGGTSALADVPSCPADMTMIPAATGYAAFCIDNTQSVAVMDQAHAQDGCYLNSKRLCSGLEMIHANSVNPISSPTRFMWTSDVMVGTSVSGVIFDTQGVSGAQLGASSSGSSTYLCCSR